MKDQKPGRVPCHFLRTKLFYIDKELGRKWLSETENTESYWCLRTVSFVGPDDLPAEPHFCGDGRSCFRPMADSSPQS